MIIQLTDNQRTIIEEATQTKYNDVREFEALKRLGPPIRENIIKGMLKRGLLEIRTDEDGGKLTLVSDMGYAAIGKAANEEPPAGSKASKMPDAPKHSKQQIMIDLLKREEGATLHQLSAATGWHGAMAGVLKKKLGLTIASDKNRDGERIYRIA
jgi:hypothetical protein